jgi:hypothetical protein
MKSYGKTHNIEIIRPIEPITQHIIVIAGRRSSSTAEKLYQDYTNEWAGASLSDSIFVQAGTQKQLLCWNCGEQGHRALDCTKPRNADRITKNRKTYKVVSTKATKERNQRSA